MSDTLTGVIVGIFIGATTVGAVIVQELIYRYQERRDGKRD